MMKKIVWVGAIVAATLAIFLSNITMATEDYRIVLILAAVLATISIVISIWIFWSGNRLWRIIALFVFLADIFVFIDFLKRAPHAF